MPGEDRPQKRFTRDLDGRNPDQAGVTCGETASEALMRTARRHPRISNLHGFQATLGRDARGAGGGGSGDADRVLNLSEGGMLIANDSLEVGQRTPFALTGPSFHYAGVAEVVHLSNETTGLRFLSWQGHDNRPIRSLIEQRSDWEPPQPSASRDTQVVRRVAVLTGPKRPSRRDAEPPGPPAGSGS
ncbi:MAG: PilZ domain-containing protein [Solirubrobacteraceae bacterium]